MDIPQIIAGRFRIECEIGRGGMGTVYRAMHLGLERPVAIKVLKKEIAADPEVAERFMREARTMARLRHSRAAMIFDAGRLADGRPFIVMEYVEGHTLAETLSREGRLSPERAVRIASEICDVLGEAHQLGIVHRDLKPSNIMLNERGICVLDFGIAKVLATTDATKTHPTTESGLVIGTPRYMSPEQCMGQKVGPASDLYSVGVMVYEMLAGHPPFIDQLSSAVLVKQATTVPPPLVGARPDVPRALALVVHTLLAKNPVNRPKTAADVRALLERSVAPAPRDPTLQTPPFAATIAALDTGTSAIFRAATAFAIVVMLGVVLFAWTHNRPASINLDRLPEDSRSEAASVVSRGSASSATKERGARAAAPAAVRASIKPVLSTDTAQQIAQSVTRGPINDAQIVRTKNGQVIAAVHEQRREGASHLYLMEQRGGRFQVTARAPLDTGGFRGAKWTTEVVDVDHDGYDEILCTGDQPRGDKGQRRLVLYVPRARKTYSVSLTPDKRRAGASHTTWSSNMTNGKASPYRDALEQRASTRTF